MQYSKIKKTILSVASIALATGVVATADLPITVPNPAVITAEAEGFGFSAEALEPAQLFSFGPASFVSMYNQLGLTDKSDTLKTTDKKYKILNDVESVNVKIHFDTNADRTVIYSVTIKGNELEHIKSAMMRTMYMINKRGVQEAGAAFDKMFVQETSDEEGVLEERIFLNKEAPDTLRIHALW